MASSEINDYDIAFPNVVRARSIPLQDIFKDVLVMLWCVEGRRGKWREKRRKEEREGEEKRRESRKREKRK